MIKDNRGYVLITVIGVISLTVVVMLTAVVYINNIVKNVYRYSSIIKENNNFNSSLERIEGLLTSNIYMFENEILFEDLNVSFEVVSDTIETDEKVYCGEILYDDVREFVINNTDEFILSMYLIGVEGFEEGFLEVDFALLDNNNQNIASGLVDSNITHIGISNLNIENLGVYKLCIDNLINGCKLVYELKYDKLILRELNLKNDAFLGVIVVENDFEDFELNKISWK